jgi:hypothetical protein
VKAPIKIPKLYPTETISIEGNNIELRGYKAAERPYVILIETIQKEMPPLLTHIGGIEKEIQSLTQDEEGNRYSDEELESMGALDKVLNLTNKITDIKLRIDEVSDKLIYGETNPENPDEMSGPGYLLAQRGLKRFYYPNMSTTELDEIEDIEIARQHVMLIANTMISLSNPPKGLQKSIEDKVREEKKAAGKGKSTRGKKASRGKKKS